MDAADAVLERPRVQTVWVEVTTRTQRQLVRLLDDDTTFIQTEGGAVVGDLRPILIQVGDQVAVMGKVAWRLPESSGRIAIIEESQLETAQTVTKVLRAVADWMWLVALAVAALAVWLARGRRRLELRAIAIGLLVVGLLLLGGAPLRRRLPRRRAREGRRRQAGGARRVEHPHAGPGRPRLGVDHPRRRHAARSLVRRRYRVARHEARRAARPGPREPRRRPTRIAAVALLALVLVAPPIARGWLSALLLVVLVVVGIEVVRNIVEREEQQSA